MFLLNEYSWGVTLKPKLGTGFPVTALILLQKKKKKKKHQFIKFKTKQNMLTTCPLKDNGQCVSAILLRLLSKN